ncbi:MAG: hypothetical protein JWQ44_2823 [Chthoniobacter sp.]|nr:hypothetical protein [Chthoniobacter sp.]
MSCTNLPAVNFPANERKVTDAAARLIEKSGADVDYLRIVKLAYLADRRAILERGVPIFGGHYFSMRKGPTIGEVMDFVGQRTAPRWKATISARKGNALNLVGETSFDTLTEAELKILDEVVEEHRTRSTGELVKWCHDNCGEYRDVLFGRKPIQVEDILKAEGQPETRIAKISKRAKELAELDALLA